MQRINKQSIENPCVWDKVWEDAHDDESFRWCAQHELAGVRGRRVISYIEKHLGALNQIKAAEVGAGGGAYSFILSGYGANVTLLDYSQKALSLARKHFDSAGLKASFVCADAFNLAPQLLEEFDVAMSFGTIEHFRHPDRFLMAKAHFDLIRPGGVVIISAPNRWFFPHEILKFFLQKKGRWQLGYEAAFTKKEFLRIGNGVGLKDMEVAGSGFITDMCRYFCIFGRTRFFKRFFQMVPKEAPVEDCPSFFDDFLGADIFLMGRKPL